MKKGILIIGAGCSFGYSLMQELAAKWNTFVVTEHKDRFPELLNNISELKKSFPDIDVCSYRVDITCVSDIDGAIKDAEGYAITIAAAVYCAGANSLEPAENVDEHMWNRILDINLKGFFFASRAIALHMEERDVKGSIVAIASQHAVVANYNRAPYCASKAGLVHLIREMALEFAESGIRFNAVSPSFIVNQRNRNLLYSPRLSEEYLDNIPLGRYAEAEDVAAAVSFLISDKASFITGHNLILDGGYTIR